jgi:hypothetical protein
MNERIGKLLSRSGGEFYEGFLGIPNTIRFTEDELKTFIDLIVRECVSLVKENYDDTLPYGGIDYLFEDFGIGE